MELPRNVSWSKGLVQEPEVKLSEVEVVVQQQQQQTQPLMWSAYKGYSEVPTVATVSQRRSKRRSSVWKRLQKWVASRFQETRREEATNEGRPRANRMLLRDAYDHQSNGRWNIKRVGGSWVSMYLDDWFNTIVHLPFTRLLLVLALFYIFVVSIFAAAYLSFARQCGMDFSDVLEAYYFSLETMATIGYGTSDYFFGHCWEPLVIINLQVTISLVVESLYFGIIFHRLTRGRRRTNTVLFSDKAVVRRVGDAYYLLFQVCELRRHHLLDAKIRVFAVRHERDASGLTAYYQAHRLSLRRPNDAAGGMLLMALPQLVVHRLEVTSPLMPPPTWMSHTGPRHWAGLGKKVPSQQHHRRGRSDDMLTHAARMRSPPPRSSSTFAIGTHDSSRRQQQTVRSPPRRTTSQTRLKDADDDQLRLPLMMNSRSSTLEKDENDQKKKKKKRKQCEAPDFDASVHEELDNAEVMSSPEPSPKSKGETAKTDENVHLLGDDDPDDPDLRQADLLKRNVELFFKDRDVEIIAIVEGNDEYTSRLVQARHSYKLNDIVWWHNFAPSVFRQQDGSCLIDFSEFHRTLPTNSSTTNSNNARGI